MGDDGFKEREKTSISSIGSGTNADGVFSNFKLVLFSVVGISCYCSAAGLGMFLPNLVQSGGRHADRWAGKQKI